ncbi:uncharacterized protein LOC129566153 [Sitodiplosis mosellana]|uniref:uncharacterized protein LOC129566153 n=1 Tax=Sitodiplosis mosellana TaxID=263140 RepID=UPI002443E52D|nr:uncharacterized protein LOC129566153 [Sitodiplosis mosellana]XP_055299045.1 uncharacterized protein LOC129566153 [Sitodiplosis mosellana]
MYSRNQLSPDLIQVNQSFEQVIVDLDDGNQFLMFKCKCGFIVRNNMLTKQAHWKRCPSKFSFRYLSQNESAGGCVIICTMCSIKFMSPDIITMRTHSQKCTRIAHQPTNSMPYTFSSSYTGSNSRFDTNQTSNAVKNIHENAVSRKEIDAQRKVLMAKNGKIPIPGFRIKYVSNENGPERYSECLICKTLFRKPTNCTLKAHRAMCLYPSNVLMSVSTQPMVPFPFTSLSSTPHSLNAHQHSPFHPMNTHSMVAQPRPSDSMPLPPMSHVSSHQMPSYQMPSHQMPSHTMVSQSPDSQPFDLTITSSIQGDGMSRFTIKENISRFTPRSPIKMCFICNTATSESFVSLYRTMSMHSNTKIYDFVWQFLNDQPSVRDSSAAAANSNWSLVCAECLDMINEYDYARVTAAKFENCLRDKLSRTEMYHVNRRDNVAIPLESPITSAQRESEKQKQLQGHQYADRTPPNEVNTTVRDGGERYADESNDAVHYLVELSDEEDNEVEEEIEKVETIELSDEEDA